MCLLELSYHGITISISNSLEIGNEGVERIRQVTTGSWDSIYYQLRKYYVITDFRYLIEEKMNEN